MSGINCLVYTDFVTHIEGFELHDDLLRDASKSGQYLPRMMQSIYHLFFILQICPLLCQVFLDMKVHFL